MIIGRLFGTGIEYIGSEDDGTIEATSFSIVKEFKADLSTPIPPGFLRDRGEETFQTAFGRMLLYPSIVSETVK